MAARKNMAARKKTKARQPNQPDRPQKPMPTSAAAGRATCGRRCRAGRQRGRPARAHVSRRLRRFLSFHRADRGRAKTYPHRLRGSCQRPRHHARRRFADGASLQFAAGVDHRYAPARRPHFRLRHLQGDFPQDHRRARLDVVVRGSQQSRTPWRSRASLTAMAAQVRNSLAARGASILMTRELSVMAENITGDDDSWPARPETRQRSRSSTVASPTRRNTATTKPAIRRHCRRISSRPGFPRKFSVRRSTRQLVSQMTNKNQQYLAAAELIGRQQVRWPFAPQFKGAARGLSQGGVPAYRISTIFRN